MAPREHRRDDRAVTRAPRAPRAAADERFDGAYYERYYHAADSRVTDAAAIGKVARLVAAWCDHLDLPVRHVLDVGCGVGLWRDAVAAIWPRARYHGVEWSEHACERFGWTRGSVVTFEPRRELGRATFDLVVCQGVLQYLPDRAAATALANLGRWCRGALYLEALTARDWREHCDRERTDGDVHLREGAWYRRRLARDFLACGGGVFVARAAGCTLFELEGS
jgi:SAM-dependent methyltransferase